MGIGAFHAPYELGNIALIYAELQNAAAQFADREAVVTPSHRCTYGELAIEARSMAGEFVGITSAAVTISGDDLPRMVAVLAAADAVGASAELSRTDLQVRRIVAVRSANSSVDRGAIHDKGAQAQGVVILRTSGTSGPPKPAVHTWQSLAAAVQRRNERYLGRRWLLSYQPQSFAGLQVLLQALLTGGTLVAPDRGSPRHIVDCLHREQIEMASATPTFWRTLLHAADDEELRGSTLRQVTLGGEIADQPLLDRLRESFPQARICHVYASTEMGVCFAVHDGQAGFPAAWLDDESRPCALRVAEDGELLIRSPRRALVTPSPRHPLTLSLSTGWFATGDLVRIEGARAYFAGRKSDTIHVGGNKVQPVDVEAVIRACPSVRDVRVFALESSLTGQLVAAEVWATGEDAEVAVRQDILHRCRELLPKHAQPAVLTFATSTLTDGDKLSRVHEMHQDDLVHCLHPTGGGS